VSNTTAKVNPIHDLTSCGRMPLAKLLSVVGVGEEIEAAVAAITVVCGGHVE